MLKIKQENIVDVFDSLTGLFDDIGITFDKNGLTINQADRSMVVFVDVRLKPSVFEEYKLDKNEDFSIGLNGFVDVLKRFKKEDRITLEINKSRLTLSNGNKYFKLPLLNTSKNEKPDVSKLDFKADIEMSESLFQEAIRDSSLFAESMTLELNSKELVFKSQGDGEYQKKVFVGESDLKTILNTKCTSRYSIDYLQKIFKKPFGDHVNVKFSNDYPIKISFNDENKEVSFILAPRLNEEEESQEVAKDKPKDDKDEQGNDEE